MYGYLDRSRPRRAVRPSRTTSIGERLRSVASCCRAWRTSIASSAIWRPVFIRCFVLEPRPPTFTSGRDVPGIGTPSTLRLPPRASAIPPTRPASAAPPATAGTFAAPAALPTARPASPAALPTARRALWAPSTTLPRAEATGPPLEVPRELLLLRELLGRRDFGAEPSPLERFVAVGVRLAAVAGRVAPRGLVAPPERLPDGFEDFGVFWVLFCVSF